MIKECNVLINNDIVTVVRFGDIDVQLPSIHRNAKTVRVANTDGKYRVVSDDYKEPEPAQATRKKNNRSSKKTTIKKSTIDKEPITEEGSANDSN